MRDRRRGFSAAEQLATVAPMLVLWLLGLAVLGVVVTRTPDHQADLLIDPVESGHLPWYAGLVSSLGIVGWCVAMTASGLGAVTARFARRPAASAFLGGGTLMCALLLLDDLFLLHSSVLNKTLGVPKLAIVGAYALAATAWIVANTGEIVRTRWQILLAGGAAIVTSAAIDGLGAQIGDLGLVAEDGPKFLGIIALATYFGLTTIDIVRSITTARPAPVPPAIRVYRAGDVEVVIDSTH